MLLRYDTTPPADVSIIQLSPHYVNEMWVAGHVCLKRRLDKSYALTQLEAGPSSPTDPP
jgi:hypothetical protein